MKSATDVNMLTLMNLAGVEQEAALEKLKTTVLVTAADDIASTTLAANVSQLLERTFQVVFLSPADVHISIGVDEIAAGPVHLRVQITDDSEIVLLAEHDNSPCATDNPSPPGLLLKVAACYVAGQAIARSIARELAWASNFVISAARLGVTVEELRGTVDLDEAVLIGGGGVANGLLWALEEVDARGTMDVVDPKGVSDSNLNRCLYFGPEDLKKPKAEVLAEKFKHPHLQLVPSVGTFAALNKEKKRVRRAITTTDSRAARRNVRNEYPLEIIDASTTGLTEVITFSEKQPSDVACLACIYIHIAQETQRENHIADALGLDIDEVKRQLIDAHLASKLASIHPTLNAREIEGMAMDSLFRELCGSGNLLDAEVEQVLAPLAFISNLAGALLAVELLRAESPRKPTESENYLCLNPWAPPFARARRFKGKQAACEFCHGEHTDELMRALWPDEFKSVS
jgi:molybdopterin/thiamine biosynthesis adenylyltransferase